MRKRFWVMDVSGTAPCGSTFWMSEDSVPKGLELPAGWSLVEVTQKRPEEQEVIGTVLVVAGDIASFDEHIRYLKTSFTNGCEFTKRVQGAVINGVYYQHVHNIFQMRGMRDVEIIFLPGSELLRDYNEMMTYARMIDRVTKK